MKTLYRENTGSADALHQGPWFANYASRSRLFDLRPMPELSGERGRVKTNQARPNLTLNSAEIHVSMRLLLNHNFED